MELAAVTGTGRYERMFVGLGVSFCTRLMEIIRAVLADPVGIAPGLLYLTAVRVSLVIAGQIVIDYFGFAARIVLDKLAAANLGYLALAASGADCADVGKLRTDRQALGQRSFTGSDRVFANIT